MNRRINLNSTAVFTREQIRSAVNNTADMEGYNRVMTSVFKRLIVRDDINDHYEDMYMSQEARITLLIQVVFDAIPAMEKDGAVKWDRSQLQQELTVQALHRVMSPMVTNLSLTINGLDNHDLGHISHGVATAIAGGHITGITILAQ